MLPIMCTYT